MGYGEDRIERTQTARATRDAAYALERRGVGSGAGRVPAGACAAERDPASGVVQLVATDAKADIV
jgi:hypothetical protein